jgi:hypothetical protein
MAALSAGGTNPAQLTWFMFAIQRENLAGTPSLLPTDPAANDIKVPAIMDHAFLKKQACHRPAKRKR